MKQLQQLASFFVCLRRCGNTCVACYASVATPLRQTKTLRQLSNFFRARSLVALSSKGWCVEPALLLKIIRNCENSQTENLNIQTRFQSSLKL
jgi:hypothetical protein